MRVPELLKVMPQPPQKATVHMLSDWMKKAPPLAMVGAVEPLKLRMRPLDQVEVEPGWGGEGAAVVAVHLGAAAVQAHGGAGEQGGCQSPASRRRSR